MPDAEADRLCNAQRYEHTEGRMDTQAGSYGRRLQTKAGLVNLKPPRLCKATLQTVTIDRYRRRESSVEEALIQMYLVGVSVRRIEDITQAPWGTRVGPGTVSELSKKVYGRVGKFQILAYLQKLTPFSVLNSRRSLNADVELSSQQTVRKTRY